eukprot:CAMPEP_0197035046 /NCGR_PEP_ID=MMETSP1384-20130603/12943_1 /TAXON_ID=29189 /ORGANISM="Ammonia sp." /LENGTH=1182 /DNA_ID=CAMNT_0042465049 /DNA_START=2250 /DNA_END=5798 /DNA_ORIENTATION=+
MAEEVALLRSSQAHSISKPLLERKLKVGEKWCAVDKKWYAQFEHFAYLNEKETTIDESTECELEQRPPPPKMNNSDLKCASNTFELKRELIENKDFVWIHRELYDYLLDWFGVEGGSLNFEREVINIGNEVMDEIVIERNPTFICYVLSDHHGKPDMNSKRIVAVSCHSNLNKLVDTLSDGKPERVRVWRRTQQTKEPEPAPPNEGEWQPFPDNEDELPPAYDDLDKHDAAQAGAAEGGEGEGPRDGDAPPPLEAPPHEEPPQEEAQQEDDEWELVKERDCSVAFGEWALNMDLVSSVNYMLEIQDEDGNWKREYDAEKWRKSMVVGTQIDIYDKAYSKWYSGRVVEIGEDDESGKFKVSYDGYSANYDEYIEVDSWRLAPLNTHTQPDPFWNSFDASPSTNYNYSYYNDDEATAPQSNGCVGLRNLGNTCFMNSTIQCLSHCPLLVHYFLDYERVSAEINKDNPLGWNGRVAETWSKLLRKYWSAKYSVLSPSNLKSTIAQIQPRFSGYQQHDSSELLQFLLDGLHEDLNRVKQKPYTEKIESNTEEKDTEIARKSWETHKLRNNSIIVDLIQGQLKSKVQCPDCARISVTFDPFMFLSVPLPTEKKFVVKTLTVVHLDLNILPKKYAVRLPALSAISDLLDSLEALTKIPRTRLVLCEIWSSHIHKVFKNYEPIDQISDLRSNHVVCYEVPTDQEMERLLFSRADSDSDSDSGKPVKFTLVPIYHQSVKQSTYFNSLHVSYDDIGMPLLMKLPVEYEIDVVLLYQLLTKMMQPYFQNFDKWDADKHVHAKTVHAEAVADDNIRSLDSGDDDDDNPGGSHAPALFDDDSDDAAGYQQPHSSSEQEAEEEEEEGGAAAEAEDKKPLIEAGETEKEENKDDQEEEEEEERDDEHSLPYTFVILNQYGSRCGVCTYMSNCNGCRLNKLADSKWKIADSVYETYDRKSIAIRWKVGAKKCFQHNAFLSPLHDVSMERESTLESETSSRSMFSNNYGAQKSIDLSACIDEFVAEETLSKNDAWYCRDCNDHKCATKKLDLYRLPSICIIHLKRFTQNGYYREKNDAPVSYPINGLNLSNWIQSETETETESEQQLYDLFAVSIHSGGLGGGHYIAYAKNLDNQQWYEFDDSCVSQINEQDAYTSSAYVLFYVKRNLQTPSIASVANNTETQTAVDVDADKDKDKKD